MIIRAGAAARDLAEALAATVRLSEIPASHWDEVVEQLKEILLPMSGQPK